jgi:hypothetical protein
MCFGKKSFCLSNTEGCLDVLLKCPDGCNLEQFEASGHRLGFGRKVLIVRMDARDLNFTVLISTQSLHEAYN